MSKCTDAVTEPPRCDGSAIVPITPAHRRVDEVRKRHGLAERVVRAEEAFGRALRQHDATRLAERTTRVAGDKRQVEDVEKFRVRRNGGQPDRAIAGRYRNVVDERAGAGGGFDLRIIRLQIARRVRVRHRRLAKNDGAVREYDAAGDDERAVRVREMTFGAAPKPGDRVGGDEGRKTEREHDHVRERGERCLAEIQQRDREVVSEHVNPR